ncbi:MAG: hypothetical protein D6675_07075 [Gemmatimonadetes bacterium]|nr:MAG: hypothetical protein D6675_07075 [Gemmatimonadota bacterium]
MQLERIQQLIQEIWDTVNTSDDLNQFIETYGAELDPDFLVGIEMIIADMLKEGEDEMAAYFEEIYDRLEAIISTKHPTPETSTSVKKAIELVRIVLEEVNDMDELDQFVEQYYDDFNEAFFAVLDYLIQEENERDNVEQSVFYQAVKEEISLRLGLNIA